MKLHIDAHMLRDALATVRPAIATRSTLPVLQCVLIDGDGVIQATNLDTHIATRLGTKSEGDDGGAIAVPGSLLIDLVAQMPPGQITLEMVERTKLRIVGHGAKAHLSGINASEFPLRAESDGDRLRMDSDKLREGIDRVIYAAAKGESRPILTGVHIFVKNKIMELACSDGYRLAQAWMGVDLPGEVDMVVPATGVAAIRRILPMERSVVVTVDPRRSHLTVEDNGTIASIRTIEGNFPNVSSIIPTEFETTVGIENHELTQAIRRAEIVARGGQTRRGAFSLWPRSAQHMVILEVAEGAVVVSGEGEEGSSRSEIPANVEGEGVRFALDARHALDALGALPGNEAQLRLNGRFKPVEIRAPGADCMGLIMPMTEKQGDA